MHALSPVPVPATRLAAAAIQVGYDDRVVIDDLTVRIPDGKVTAVVGANSLRPADETKV